MESNGKQFDCLYACGAASNLDDALSQLAVTDGGGEDRHPERRMKAVSMKEVVPLARRLVFEMPNTTITACSVVRYMLLLGVSSVRGANAA